MSDEIKSLPEGNHNATIVDFGSIVSSKARSGIWIMPVLCDTQDGSRIVVHVAGFLGTIRMIFAARDDYVGKRVVVKLRHRVHNKVLTYSCDFLWEKGWQ